MQFPEASFFIAKALNSNQLDNSLNINIGKICENPAASHIGDLHILWYLTFRSVSASAHRIHSIAVLAHLQNGKESLLGDIDATDPLHSFFAFFLFFQQLALA